jgi:hypothetical protein
MPSSESTATAARHALIRSHIERLVGRIVGEFPDSRAPASGLSVLQLGPSDTRPLHTLITLGLSDLPMTAPANVEADAPRYIELMMTLPAHWQLDTASLQQTQWSWPVDELLRLAHLSRDQGQWLGWGTSIANGAPSIAYAPNTALSAVILAPSLLVKQDFYELGSDDRRIVFLSAIPLYREEYELQQRDGMQTLLGKLLDRDIKDLVQPRRRNVAKKRFGLF